MKLPPELQSIIDKAEASDDGAVFKRAEKNGKKDRAAIVGFILHLARSNHISSENRAEWTLAALEYLSACIQRDMLLNITRCKNGDHALLSVIEAGIQATHEAAKFKAEIRDIILSHPELKG